MGSEETSQAEATASGDSDTVHMHTVSSNASGTISADGDLQIHLMKVNGELLASVALQPGAELVTLYDQARQAAEGQPCQLLFEGSVLLRSKSTLQMVGLHSGAEICIALGQPLFEDLKLWFRADDLEPGPVASWLDARAGREAAQATAEHRPTLVPEALGMHNVVRFGASGTTFLTLPPTDSDKSFRGVTVMAVVANVATPSPEKPPVHDRRTDAHEAFLFDVGFVNDAGYGFCVADQGSGLMKFSAHSPTRTGGSHIKPIVPTDPGQDRRFHTIAYRLDFDRTMSLMWDGVEVGTVPVQIREGFPACGTADNPLTIGAMSKDPPNSQVKHRRRFVGDLAELLVYDTALSLEDIAAMDIYLKRRFA